MMKEKMNSRKGFTLAELLIVVAIIAILVAIMIPVFGSSRAEAILSKDAANLRSVYSEAVIEAMTISEDMSDMKVDIKKALQNSGVIFDKITVVKCVQPTATNNGKFVVSNNKTSKTEEIVIDKDIKILMNGSTYTASEFTVAQNSNLS